MADGSQFAISTTVCATEWSARSEFWIAETTKSAKKLKRRERNSKALILTGHGVSLRIDNGALLIRDGFTHYPQTHNQWRFFRGDLALPPRIVLLDGSGTLSFDVLTWLADQSVALARVTWQGDVAIVASGTGCATDREKVAWQIRTRDDPVARMNFAKDLITHKIENTLSTLQTVMAAYDITKAADKAQACIEAIRNLSPDNDINLLRMIEGECAVAYFNVWKVIALSWKGLGKKPIPVEWQTYRSRSSILNGVKAKNKRASHPINAMLNYAYAVRKAHLQIEAIADGYDPTIGILHHDREGFAAYIYDLIESERPKVDAVILDFIARHTFSAADFVIRSDGVCRLSPQLAKTVAGLVS